MRAVDATVFDECSYEPIVLGRVHDDEIAALTDRLRAVETPAGADAARGRELIAARTDDDPDPDDLLTLARHWESIAVLEQHGGNGEDITTVFYHRHDAFSVIESVHDGWHQFQAARTAAAWDGAVSMISPHPESSEEQGPAQSYSPEQWVQFSATHLIGVEVVTVAAGLRRFNGRTLDRRLTAYTFPDLTAVALPTTDDRLSFAVTNRRHLRRYLTALVDPARRAPEHP